MINYASAGISCHRVFVSLYVSVTRQYCIEMAA